MLNLDVVNLVVLMLAKWWTLAALTLMLVAHSRNTSASTLHAILLFALLALCCLPWLQQITPTVNIKILPAHFAQSSQQPGLFIGFALAYAAVVAGFWANLFWQLYKLRQLNKCAENFVIPRHTHLLRKLRQSLGISRPITLIYSEGVSTPLTFGWLAPIIVLPSVSQHWGTDRLRRFLLHELAHVRRGDWLSKILARLLVSALWILPSAWILLQKIEWFAELACDDAVIRAERGGRAEYADDLLEMTACGHISNGAMALIEKHGHYERIATVLDGGRVRTSDCVKFWPYAAVFCAVLLLLASVRLAPATQLPVSPYKWIPLVVATTEMESVTQILTQTPARPQKLSLEDIPAALPQPHLEMPVIENAILEREPLTPHIDVPAAIIAVDIATQLKPLHMPLPEYPERALKKNIQGRVVAEFDVLPDGRVQGVTIVAAEPARYFDQVVKAALTQYRYPPQPGVITGMTEVFEFKLLEDAHSIPAAKK
jgi:bla regulator protein blaR1